MYETPGTRSDGEHTNRREYRGRNTRARRPPTTYVAERIDGDRSSVILAGTRFGLHAGPQTIASGTFAGAIELSAACMRSRLYACLRAIRYGPTRIRKFVIGRIYAPAAVTENLATVSPIPASLFCDGRQRVINWTAIRKREL